MKKNILFHIIFIILFSISANAQVNLVPNYSFEEKDSCAVGPRGIDPLCKEWFTPMKYSNPIYNPFTPNNYGSSDYFNECNLLSVPKNSWGYQNAVSGVAYAGFALLGGWVPPTGLENHREYIEVKLYEKLIKNRLYCIEFYYSISMKPINYHAINIEVLITDTVVNRQQGESSWFADIFANAQISQSLPTNFDTINWLKVESTFTAKGNEQYITIGNFDELPNINNPPEMSSSVLIYIYVDDVKLWYCDEDTTLNIDTTINHVDSMIVPNVFTPNDDGYNDKFEFKNQEQWEYETQIFNRWGHLIFDNGNSENWNGYINGEKATTGVYYYVIKATANKTGKVVVYRGTVTMFY